MKNLFKNKKLMIAALSVLLLAVMTVIGIAGLADKKPAQTEPSESTSDCPASTESIDIPDVSDETESIETDEPDKPESEIIPNGSGLTPSESEEVDTTQPPDEKQDEPEETEKPIEEKPVLKEEDDTTDGVVIGDGGTGEAYRCGADNHHCSNEYTHATILNLELEGCPTCGSHTCRSFYALDEWGNTLYTPSECPKYNVQADPVYYFQSCGKPTGNGENGTCVFYIVDTVCSECGEKVKAWECHSCK